jgi:hypothetical protein
MLEIFNDDIIEYDDKENIFDAYKKKCCEYRVDPYIPYYIRQDVYPQHIYNMYNDFKQKLLKPSKPYNEIYLRYLSDYFAKMCSAHTINVYCFFKIFQNVSARDTVDKIIKHIATSQNKKIYRVIYCNQEDKRKQYGNMRCIRPIDAASNDDLMNDVMKNDGNDFNINNKYNLPQNITEPENIFGYDGNSVFSILNKTKFEDYSLNLGDKLNELLDMASKYNDRNIFIRKKLTKRQLINQIYNHVHSKITNKTYLEKWEKSFCTQCGSNVSGTQYCTECGTKNENY